MTFIGRGTLILASMALGAMAVPALAQERVAPATAAAAAIAPASRDAPFGAAPVDDASLSRETGREDIGTMAASATQRNTVANNSVIGTSSTGSIAIDGNAFQNLQGLAVISANSGNNVAINSAMNVTIAMGAP